MKNISSDFSFTDDHSDEYILCVLGSHFPLEINDFVILL